MRYTKFFSIIMLIASMFVAVSCDGGTRSAEDIKVKKVADYLYETTLDYDYDWATCRPYFSKYKPQVGACSSFSVGNKRGRNLDWFYSDGVEFVVHTPKTENRHGSIGMASLTSLPNHVASECRYNEKFQLLPFLTLDGINDAGIFVNANVVPFRDEGSWVMKTETEDDDIFELTGPRFILDNCSYLSDIVPLYDKYDWIPLGTMNEIHLMVTGPRSAEDSTVTTVVFELIPFDVDGRSVRKLCCISQDEKDIAIVNNDAFRFFQIDTEYLIMTNFHLWQFDASADRKGRILSITNHAMGFERYETIEAAIISAVQLAGGKDSLTDAQVHDIMRTVYYSNLYNLFCENYWYTDCDDIPSKEYLIAATDAQRNPRGNLENVLRGPDGKTYENIKNDVKLWTKRDRAAGQSLWETIRTNIYDYKNRSFKVIMHEGTDYYEFKLGM